MMRHAAHGNRIATFFVSRRQSDLQFARADDRVIKKQFVEIAETKEQECARMLRFQLLILPYHWSSITRRHRFAVRGLTRSSIALSCGAKRQAYIASHERAIELRVRPL